MKKPVLIIGALAVASAVAVAAFRCPTSYDVVIYGGTSAGIATAVQVIRMGKNPVVIEPSNRIGGLTTGGLGQTDIGNKSAFGGIALEFYRDVFKHYSDPSAWKYEKRENYMPDGQCAGTQGDGSMWTFEPSAALKILQTWVARDKIKIIYGERLDRSANGIEKKDGRICRIKMESGRTFRGKMFIDATYEGDLLAAAGVDYIVGREANSVYGEKNSGIQRANAVSHQFNPGVDPYVEKGNPASGLLPYLEVDTDDPDGSGDKRLQAYCFRMCLTNNPENRIPFAKPEGYNPLNYELLLRNLEAIKPETFIANANRPWKYMPWINSRMPNRKTDTNNRTGFSTDFIGGNWSWPEASYTERAKILQAHLDYQRGLMWTLANNPRVPAPIREEIAKWGTCKDEFTDGLGYGWQGQLYVREARRMIGEYVMTEANCRHQTTASRSIAKGAYTMDSHNVRRYVDKNGFARNEGDIQDGETVRLGPYPIDYGAIIPKKTQCTNLIVPICISASHMAFGSIRMEPVFFALGQVAGTAAVQSIDADIAVQDLPYETLREQLLKDGQVL